MVVINTKLLLNRFNTLFVNKKQDIKQIGKILSNDKRLKILDLSNGNTNKGEIIEKLGIDKRAVFQHFSVINDLPENLKLIKKWRDGNQVKYVKNYDYILIAL